MISKKFRYMTDQILAAISVCYSNKLITPAMMLIYSGIDIMAWLDMPENKMKQEREDFERWVERYFIKHVNEKCSKEDIYGARCGLLHMYSPDSTYYKNGKAKKIYYAWGVRTEDELREYAGICKREDIIALQMEEIQLAFMSAIAVFEDDINNDEKKCNIVNERLNQILSEFDG